MIEEEEGSKIFRGFRALGYISDHIPLVTRYIRRRRETLIVTSVGKVFHTYGGAKLGLLSVSKIHPEDITALAADSFLVFAAAGKDIYAWRRGSELKHIYRGHERNVHLMLPFGPHLISIDRRSLLKIWDIRTETLAVELEFNNSHFEITSIVHPATYINKILLGSRQGPLQLWNIKSCKCIYKFSGWNSPVLCMEQAPAVDVVAIGLASGEIIVHNLKYDETIVKFKQDWGPVSGLTFRTDGHPILVSTSNLGHIALWDLENRKLSAQMRDAHPGAIISGAKCFQGEPLLITSSPDNSLKQWIFDLPDGGGRLLRIREGHSEPPLKIRFYGALGNNILSSSQDSSLRSFSTVTELLDKSFGVASYNRKLAKKHRKIDNPVKMEPIIDFTTETTREKEWDNIACVHRSTSIVTTWTFKQQRMGELKLKHPRFKMDFPEAVATCLCLSICGNFVFIGYTTGHIDKYNIQSGIHRGSYGKGKETIRGLATDGLNQTVISGSMTGIVKFYSFVNHNLIGKLKVTDEDGDRLGIMLMELHRDSGLLAIALDDFSLIIVDIVSQLIVRRFPLSHKNHITDLTFSPDSRWILSSSLDSSVKVWDIPSGTLIDHFKCPSPVTSLTMSPKGDFLATCHEGDLGIYLWSNVTLYSHISLKPLSPDHQPKTISLPTMKQKTTEDFVQDNNDDIEMDVVESDEFVSPMQIAEDLITLACLPSSRWQNLLSLEIIKERNKPSKAPEKPKSAPFFLPTVSGLTTSFDLSKSIEGSESQILIDGAKVPLISNYTDFGKSLLKAQESELVSKIEDLKLKGPSAIEFELISLSPEGGGSKELMVTFLKMLKLALESNLNFEAVQAYLALFMKLHANDIINSREEEDEWSLITALSALQDVQERKWKELRGILDSSSTLVGFYKNALIT